MADLIAALVLIAPVAPVVVALAMLLCGSAAATDAVGRWGGLAAAAPGLTLGALALARAGEEPLSGSWWRVDAPGAVFLITVAAVGAASAVVSPG